jgi:hypothetical protein
MQVRAATLVSALIFWRTLHVVCTLQVGVRWLVASWYVLAGHPEHLRAAVALSAEMSLPGPHVVCTVHELR